MKDIYEILLQLKADIETDLPAILIANGLQDFDIYETGGSREPKTKGFFIYQDVFDYDYGDETANIIFQLQLYQIDLLTAAKYSDIVRDYLRDYSPVNLGCDLLRGINIDTWPIEQTSTTLIYITATWTAQLDSCDN